MLGNFSCFSFRLLTFLKINFLQKLFQGHNYSVKWFGSRSELKFCQFLSGSKLFAIAGRSGSVGEVLDLGIKGLLVLASPPVLSLSCFLEQDAFKPAA